MDLYSLYQLYDQHKTVDALIYTEVSGLTPLTSLLFYCSPQYKNKMFVLYNNQNTKGFTIDYIDCITILCTVHIRSVSLENLQFAIHCSMAPCSKDFCQSDIK